MSRLSVYERRMLREAAARGPEPPAPPLPAPVPATGFDTTHVTFVSRIRFGAETRANFPYLASAWDNGE